MTLRLRLTTRCVALLGVTPTLALSAQQVVSTLDVGGSRVRYADTTTVFAKTLGSTLRVESPRTTVVAGGTFSQIASGGWTAQGGISGSRFLRLGGRFHGELAASAGGTAHEDETRAGQLLAQGRAHFIGRARGAWLGGGLGTAWDGVAARELRVLDAGAWLSTGSATILTAVAPTSVGDIGSRSLRYTDATAAARWVGARAEVAASLGTRRGDSLPATGDASTWGSISGSIWVAGPVALTLSAGSYPIDYTQGYPGGRFASLALRLARRPTTKATSGSDHAPIGTIASFFVGPSADRRHRTVAVRARGATSVELTGDFTGWRPVRLRQRGHGRWTATLPIPAGKHQIALRIDGGAWMSPPGLTPIRDEFGGTTGLLVIRE